MASNPSECQAVERLQRAEKESESSLKEHVFSSRISSVDRWWGVPPKFGRCSRAFLNGDVQNTGCICCCGRCGCCFLSHWQLCCLLNQRAGLAGVEFDLVFMALLHSWVSKTYQELLKDLTASDQVAIPAESVLHRVVENKTEDHLTVSDHS